MLGGLWVLGELPSGPVALVPPGRQRFLHQMLSTLPAAQVSAVSP